MFLVKNTTLVKMEIARSSDYMVMEMDDDSYQWRQFRLDWRRNETKQDWAFRSDPSTEGQAHT